MKVFAFAILAGAVALPAQKPHSVVSSAPLSTERVGIYRDFLKSYDNGSKTKLNVGAVTETFAPMAGMGDRCLADFGTEQRKTPELHRLQPVAFKDLDVRFVDPAKHKLDDPGKTIRRGAPVQDAVLAGFTSGLFTFSEIIFDSSHTRAALSYSLVCGALCGQGGIAVYTLRDGVWRRDANANCGSWIS